MKKYWFSILTTIFGLVILTLGFTFFFIDDELFLITGCACMYANLALTCLGLAMINLPKKEKKDE